MQRTLKQLSRLGYATLAVCCLALFQNCSSPNDFADNNSQTSVLSQTHSGVGGSNGGGYDGKPYIAPDLNKKCTDGDIAQSRLRSSAI